ncbi:nicotinamide-nucleotide adenylyltransferase, NadR type [Lutibacter oricola]|uniref:Nicotinamide-nucleotide adenylyltransferase, NadR type n=1 Tax=Lutibacter oricola TaxID=762486 RepID=A0A1H3EJ19_9FLAO|nr:ATP-binding protein [Lutibacter oricola]SDX77919.1 nicotinamide-nucleotide adenylyltransferase, NadR type [Lutibacter oricola]
MEKDLRQKQTNIIKVVLFGPESTGKTTISRKLARHYNTVWVQEYAREYLQKKWNNKRELCDGSDQLPIAYGQIKLENKLVKKADKLQICDTDLLETVVYFENYYDKIIDPNLKKAALENHYDLYLLTYIDTPWEADDIRENPHQRKEMFKTFEQALKTYNKPYILLKGSLDERLKIATKEIDKLLKQTASD